VTAIAILAATGDPADAMRLVSRFDELPQVAATTAARNRALGELALAQGHVEKAVTAFDAGFPNARRRESRVSYARALLAAGDSARAERILTGMVDHPTAIYSGPEPVVPGMWRRAVHELTALIARRDRNAATAVRQRFPQMFEPPVSLTP